MATKKVNEYAEMTAAESMESFREIAAALDAEMQSEEVGNHRLIYRAESGNR